MADQWSRNIISHLISLTLILNGVSGQSCKKLSPCSCKMDSGFVVDLSSVSNNDNTPYFKDVLKPGSNNEMYSFNPCSGFTEGTGSCSDVALCKISVTGPLEQYISLGSQSTATFSVNGDVIDLHYTDGSSGSTSVVHISCDDGTLGSMEPKGTTGGPNEINLSTKLVCETNTKLSGGTIILIGFVSIIFLYIVVGVVVQRLVRKQRGVQAIPNYVFWSSVTGNIKSGIVYTVKCGKTGQRFDKI